MKTINIFLASSEELENDRNSFGNFIRRLNKTYIKRGIYLDLFEWEDYDAAYNNIQKQEEYNNYVRKSDMFLAVFYRVAKKFTIEEFDVACEEFRRKSFPKVYVYCKNTEDGDIESDDLKQFKKRLMEELGHYWSRYSNKDSMQLHFVMQLQMLEGSYNESLKVENGVVVLDGLRIAYMEKLPFVALNEDFQNINSRLNQLSQRIDDLRIEKANNPNSNFLMKEEQILLNEYNNLKDTYSKWQNDLFFTAKRVVRLIGERITDRIRRAIEAFGVGKIKEANIILDEAGYDGKIALDEYLLYKAQCSELLEEKRNNVVKSIHEILFKISFIQSDLSIVAEKKIETVKDLYNQVINMAEKIDYEKEKYFDILLEYANYLYIHADYIKALEFNFKALDISKNVFGSEHPITALVSNNIGAAYSMIPDFPRALEYHMLTKKIREKVLGKEHVDTASTYSNIGYVYSEQQNFPTALKFYEESLKIVKQVAENNHMIVAAISHNIGYVYSKLGDNPIALEYYLNALEIRKKILGEEHLETSYSYNCIGLLYLEQGDYNIALKYLFDALAIREKILGYEHPSTATSYNNIALYYLAVGDDQRSLDYFFKSLKILEKEPYKDTANAAVTYVNIADVYYNCNDYPNALLYYFNALRILEKDYDNNKMAIASCYSHIGYAYKCSSNYSDSLKCYLIAHDIYNNDLGDDHELTRDIELNIVDLLKNSKGLS